MTSIVLHKDTLHAQVRLSLCRDRRQMVVGRKHHQAQHSSHPRGARALPSPPPSGFSANVDPRSNLLIPIMATSARVSMFRSYFYTRVGKRNREDDASVQLKCEPVSRRLAIFFGCLLWHISGARGRAQAIQLAYSLGVGMVKRSPGLRCPEDPSSPWIIPQNTINERRRCPLPMLMKD